MNMIVFSILIIALFQQQYFAQIAPPNDVFYEFMNPYMNSLRSADINVLSSYADDRSWKRARGPRPLRFG
ncbi:FMRFamide-like neuropeptide [Dirofilaria immitis]